MSRYTEFPANPQLRSLSAPQWTVTRYKAACHGGTSGNVGGAGDEGVDPAITSISTTLTSDTDYCTCPVPASFAASFDSLLFKVNIVGSATSTTLDLQFYAPIVGSSGAYEYWQLLDTASAIDDSDDVLEIATRGQPVFVRVGAVNNPDGDAEAFILCAPGSVRWP